MKAFFVAAVVGCALQGCASAPHQIADRQDYLAEATRTYPGETKERVIQAAETILRISDPTDWEFRYNGNGFTGLRRYFIYAVLAAASGREKWEFSVEEKAGAETASMSISEAGTTYGSNSASNFENGMNAIPLYRLFYKRMDYMLGRRADWVTCDEELALVERSGTGRNSLGGLCGATSDGRNAPAPEPLALRSPKPVSRR